MKKIYYIFEGQTLAYALAKKLLLMENEVFFVAKDRSSIEILDGLKAFFPSLDLINHDPTDIDWIESLEITSKVGGLIILSDDDSLNFVVAWSIRQYYDDVKIVSLVNHPENEFIFKDLGVSTLSPINWMEKLIESFFNYEDVVNFFNPYVDKLSILEINVNKNDECCNKYLKDIKMPGNSIVGIIIKQNGTLMVPQGNTQILEGDKLIVLSLKEMVPDVKDALK